jgi:hypothetical protein
MKITAIVFVVFFAMALIAPVYAADHPAGDFCNPKKMEECKSKIDGLLKSVDNLRAKLLKSQVELNAGRKLTNAEADQILKNYDAVFENMPTTEGYLWDN